MNIYQDLDTVTETDGNRGPSEQEFYLPLPEGLTIKASRIHGLGLYAVMHFSADTRLGVTHVADSRFPDGFVRTPLGGFYNHEPDYPNCRVEDEGDMRVMYTSQDIEPGTEITVRYKLYNPS